MPRPPILPRLEWKRIFEHGKTFEEWLAEAEHPEHAEKMLAARESLTVSRDD